MVHITNMKLQDLRKEVGFTQQDLAEKMMCSISQIRKIEQKPITLYDCSYHFVHSLWIFLIVKNYEHEYVPFTDFVNDIVFSASVENSNEK